MMRRWRKSSKFDPYLGRRLSQKVWSKFATVFGVVALLGFSAASAYINGKTRVLKIYSSDEQDGRAALEYVNQLRYQYGKQKLTFDSRAFSLAMMRAWDMRKYKYYDHVNPQTGSCADTMKAMYGFGVGEYAAENISGYPDYSEDFFTLTKKAPIKEVVDGWMNSRGHRYNLLYEGHTSGAVACYKDKCVFLGVNNQQFGEGCHTAVQGKQFWQSAPLKPGEVTPKAF
ncbi:MAG: hypothetical protein IGS48_02485 [Oscillatoriales cyanobacterium C42_A2020_001]|nr:hypothetical protein [Leptolyngbyaceae cyanobacterium C42_A2020_001]